MGKSSVAPEIMPGEITPQPPPEAPEPEKIPLVRALLPVVMLVAVVGMVGVMVVSGAARNPMTFIFPIMMVVSTLAMLSGGGAKKSSDLGKSRREYARHLTEIRSSIADSVRAQHRRLRHIHPDPADLWPLEATNRLWERSLDDANFAAIRVGLGVQSPATPVVAPEIASPDTLDPVSAVALRRVIRSSRTVPELPVAVRLSDFPVLAIGGDPADSRALVRAMMAQLIVLHSPDDVRICSESPHWEWLKWVAHHGPGDATLTVEIVDGGQPTGEGTCVIAVGDISAELWDRAVNSGLALAVRAGRIVATTTSGDEDFASADGLSVEGAEVVARRVGKHCGSVREEKGDDRDAVLVGLGLEPPPLHVDPPVRRGRDRLRVPVGSRDDGSVVHLDIKESAEGGVGPHGLCIGATGSGKSEFLRSVVLAMAVTHPPEQLNFVLVDFKGGATFLGLEEMPHVSAVITNLSDELVLVDRMHDALSGEMTRRQEALRAAGAYKNVSDYEEARRAGHHDLEPLPALVIVVDEFSELLAARPEFAELFVAIGRLGRSLHVHLLLASQRLEEGRLRGLDSHLSYRIGLKTFSAAESRAVLGVPDAHLLPSIPGLGYLKSDAGAATKFRAAYVSGQVEHVRAVAMGGTDRARVVEFTAAGVPEVPVSVTTEGTGRTLLSTTVTAMNHIPHSAHRVWLPPLPDALVLETLTPGARLTAAVGIVDDPLKQRQSSHVVDLSGAGGHLAVVGAPRSGKSTTLRTLVLALARSTPSASLQFFIIDYGAAALVDLARLPHVRSVAHRGDTARITRTIAEVSTAVDDRERAYLDNGWHSVEEARYAGEADLVLVIDGFPALRTDHPDLADRVQRVISDGLAVGVHVVLSAHRWTELRPAVRDLMGSRIELRQAEAIDSVYDRKAAKLVPESPGRGLVAGGRALLVADSTPADVDRIAAHSRTRGDKDAEPLRLLPENIDATLHPGAIALDEERLAPVFFRPDKDRHLVIVGASGSGRTNAVTLVVDTLLDTHPTMKFLIIDYRRSLLGHVPPQRLAGYAGSSTVAGPLVKELADALRARLPGPDITAEQLSARDWWEGPEVTVVVDDQDLVGGISGNPLAPLAELIPHAVDIGLRVIVGRRISGTIRALHEPFLAAVRDSGAAAMVLSGTRDDGPLFGITPTNQAPGRGHWVEHGGTPRVVQMLEVNRAAK